MILSSVAQDAANGNSMVAGCVTEDKLFVPMTVGYKRFCRFIGIMSAIFLSFKGG